MLRWMCCGVLVALSGMPHVYGEDDLLLQDANVSSSEVRGVLRARDQAVLASELAGRITEMPYAEGDFFNKGDVLVRFDCRAYQAQHTASNASVRAATEELRNKQQLASLNSVGRFEVALAEARKAQAQAESQVYQVQVQRCQIHAPFSGQVVSKRVQAHESVSAGAPLLEVVDNRSLDIHVLIPSRWVGRLSAGQHFTLRPAQTRSGLCRSAQSLCTVVCFHRCRLAA